MKQKLQPIRGFVAGVAIIVVVVCTVLFEIHNPSLRFPTMDNFGTFKLDQSVAFYTQYGWCLLVVFVAVIVEFWLGSYTSHIRQRKIK